MMDPWYIYLVYFVSSLVLVSSILNILQRCIIPICCAPPDDPFRNMQRRQQEQSIRVSIIEPPPYVPPTTTDAYPLEELPPPRYEDAIKMSAVPAYKL